MKLVVINANFPGEVLKLIIHRISRKRQVFETYNIYIYIYIYIYINPLQHALPI